MLYVVLCYEKVNNSAKAAREGVLCTVSAAHLDAPAAKQEENPPLQISLL